MRTIIIFFLSLFFLLFKGHVDSYAADGHYSKGYYFSAKRTDKSEQQQFGKLLKDLPLVKHNHISEKKDDVVSIENEEDSEDPGYIRKQNLPIKYAVALSFSSTLYHDYHSSKNRLPLCRHLSYTSSYKYILQRVLRI